MAFGYKTLDMISAEVRGVRKMAVEVLGERRLTRTRRAVDRDAGEVFWFFHLVTFTLLRLPPSTPL